MDWDRRISGDNGTEIYQLEEDKALFERAHREVKSKGDAKKDNVKVSGGAKQNVRRQSG